MKENFKSTLARFDSFASNYSVDNRVNPNEQQALNKITKIVAEYSNEEIKDYEQAIISFLDRVASVSGNATYEEGFFTKTIHKEKICAHIDRLVTECKTKSEQVSREQLTQEQIIAKVTDNLKAENAKVAAERYEDGKKDGRVETISWLKNQLRLLPAPHQGPMLLLLEGKTPEVEPVVVQKLSEAKSSNTDQDKLHNFTKGSVKGEMIDKLVGMYDSASKAEKLLIKLLNFQALKNKNTKQISEIIADVKKSLAPYQSHFSRIDSVLEPYCKVKEDLSHQALTRKELTVCSQLLGTSALYLPQDITGSNYFVSQYAKLNQKEDIDPTTQEKYFDNFLTKFLNAAGQVSQNLENTSPTFSN